MYIHINKYIFININLYIYIYIHVALPNSVFGFYCNSSHSVWYLFSEHWALIHCCWMCSNSNVSFYDFLRSNPKMGCLQLYFKLRYCPCRDWKLLGCAVGCVYHNTTIDHCLRLAGTWLLPLGVSGVPAMSVATWEPCWKAGGLLVWFHVEVAIIFLSVAVAIWHRRSPMQ